MPIYLIISHAIIAVLGYLLCCFYKKNKPPIDTGNYNSSALISDAATKNIIDNYYANMDHSFSPITDPTYIDPFIEARLAYVSFADLKKYMGFIESLSAKNGFYANNLGVRMYYGRYPSDQIALLNQFNKNGTITANYKGRHTLVMVPTYKSGEKDIDFNPHFIEKGQPIDIKSVRKLKGLEKQISQQPNLTDSLPTGARGTNSSNNDDNDETNVNLNSFGLTPPTPNDDDGAAYLTP